VSGGNANSNYEGGCRSAVCNGAYRGGQDGAVQGAIQGAYRRAVACILQEDRLLAGSLRDNITGFSPAITIALLLASASSAISETTPLSLVVMNRLLYSGTTGLLTIISGSMGLNGDYSDFIQAEYPKLRSSD